MKFESNYLFVHLGPSDPPRGADSWECAADKLMASQLLVVASCRARGVSPTSPMLDSAADCVRIVSVSPYGLKIVGRKIWLGESMKTGTYT